MAFSLTCRRTRPAHRALDPPRRAVSSSRSPSQILCASLGDDARHRQRPSGCEVTVEDPRGAALITCQPRRPSLPHLHSEPWVRRISVVVTKSLYGDSSAGDPCHLETCFPQRVSGKSSCSENRKQHLFSFSEVRSKFNELQT